MLCLTYYGGVRISEALGLRWEDVDFVENRITIRQQLCYDKSGKRHTTNRTYIGPPKENKERPFYASPKLMEVLTEWKEEQEQNKQKYGRKYNNKEVLDDEVNGGVVKGGNYVLRMEDGSIVTNSSANHFRERVKKNVFCDADFHGMRRSIVTRLIGGGVPLTVVSEFIGHADTRTTELFYVDKTHVDDSQLVSVIKKIS